MYNKSIDQVMRELGITSTPSFYDAKSATIIKNKEYIIKKEKTKHMPFQSYEEFLPSSLEVKKEYVADATDPCAERKKPDSIRKPRHLEQAASKNKILASIQQEDIAYVRTSLYRQEDKDNTETVRINASIRFHDEEKYSELLDGNGFLKLVFRCSSRLRDLTRNNFNGPSDWAGYQNIKDFAQPHPFRMVGKGAYIGRKGGKKKITPPTAYYTALCLASESKGLVDPYILLAVGNFRTEIEMYGSDSELFHSHGEYVGE